MVATNDAFISYRRESGYAWAKLVWDALDEHGIDAFLATDAMDLLDETGDPTDVGVVTTWVNGHDEDDGDDDNDDGGDDDDGDDDGDDNDDDHDRPELREL